MLRALAVVGGVLVIAFVLFFGASVISAALNTLFGSSNRRQPSTNELHTMLLGQYSRLSTLLLQVRAANSALATLGLSPDFAKQLDGCFAKSGEPLPAPTKTTQLLGRVAHMEDLLREIRDTHAVYASLSPLVAKQVDDYLHERQRRLGA